MDKDWIYALAGVGAIAWTIGGAGPKWVRRFLWPVVCGVVSTFFGLSLFASVIGVVLMAAALSLGYGESKSETYRQAVFFLLFLSLLPFGANAYWILANYLLCSIGWRLTQDGYTPHKVWEAMNGVGQGGIVANAILSGGL